MGDLGKNKKNRYDTSTIFDLIDGEDNEISVIYHMIF